MYTAILDANVLYSASIRDLLMWLAYKKVFRAHWTQQIQDEWTRNLLKNRTDLRLETLLATQNMMNQALPFGLLKNVPSSEINLPDLNDVHVVAAAVKVRATHIVTENTRDFPKESLAPLGITAIKTDDFIGLLLAYQPKGVLEAFALQQANLKNPKMSFTELLAHLESLGLRQTTTWLAQNL
jgi:predicted nucleic acid-binding protein